MRSGHVNRSLLLIGILVMILITSSTASFSNHAVYAHSTAKVEELRFQFSSVLFYLSLWFCRYFYI